MNTHTPEADAVLDWFNRHRVRLWVVVALLLLIGFNGQWRVGPDSAIHVTVARSLAEGDGYTHPTDLQRTINPGLAYLTAVTFRAFGTDSFVAIDSLMLLCVAGVLVMCYHTVRLRLGRGAAVLTVCMLAVNETFYRYGYQVLTDMPFLLGLTGLLLGIEFWHVGGKYRRWGVGLILVSVFVMSQFRSVVLTVLTAGAAAALIEMVRGKAWRRLGAASGVAALLAVLMLTIGGGRALLRDGRRALELIEGAGGGTLDRIFTDNGPALFTEHLPEAVFGIDTGPWLGAPLALVLLVTGIALYRVRPFWGALVAGFVIQWLLLITTERYVLVLMPLLALAWWRFGLWLTTRCKPGAARFALAAVLACWFAPNLVRIGAFIVEQRARPFLASYEEGRYEALKAVAQELTKIAQPGDLILADQAPQLTWYTRLPVQGPDTLPTYGPQRDDTVERVRQAKRILLISPVDDLLNDRVSQLKLRQVEVLGVVPTPGYDEIDAYKIIQMRIRSIDWDAFRQMRESGLRPWDTNQSDRQTEQPPGQSEQPGDQPR